MPAWVSAISLIRAAIPPACSSSRLVGWPSSAARSSAKISWAYTGCPVHSVPSLSNTATRSRFGDEVRRIGVGHGGDELHDRLLGGRLTPARQLIGAHCPPPAPDVDRGPDRLIKGSVGGVSCKTNHPVRVISDLPVRRPRRPPARASTCVSRPSRAGPR